MGALQPKRRSRTLAFVVGRCTLLPPIPQKHFVEADMQEQTYPQRLTDPAPIPAADQRRANEDWKKQLDQMLDEYRSRFVLRRDSRGNDPIECEFDGG